MSEELKAVFPDTHLIRTAYHVGSFTYSLLCGDARSDVLNLDADCFQVAPRLVHDPSINSRFAFTHKKAILLRYGK